MTRAQRIEQLSRQGPIQNWERIVELEDALVAVLAVAIVSDDDWGPEAAAKGEAALRQAEAALARGASE